jgi:hypothetical protein
MRAYLCGEPSQLDTSSCDEAALAVIAEEVPALCSSDGTGRRLQDGDGTGGDAQPCPTETEACVADTDCATIMQQQENNEEACAGNTLCAALQSCMIASAMQGQPCGDETTACFTDDTCLGLIDVPDGQDFDIEACNADALCGPWLTCQFANSGDDQDAPPECIMGQLEPFMAGDDEAGMHAYICGEPSQLDTAASNDSGAQLVTQGDT